MGLFFGFKKKNKTVLVFDVNSSRVAGAMLHVKESEIPEILASVHEPIVVEENFDVQNFLTLMIGALSKVSEKIFREKVGAPDEVYCVLSSPWYASQGRVIRLEKDTPFVFDAKLATDLIKKEASTFKAEYFAKSSEKRTRVIPIELKNIKTVLNGYETAHPLNQKVKDLEMSVFVSMAEEKVLNKIESTISKNFSFEKIKYFSSLMATFAVIRNIPRYKENFLIMNISGELTDISMVKKGVLSESISYPIGTNFFIREFANNFKSTIPEANSLISMFFNEHADSKVVRKVEPLLKDLRSTWLKKFQESLANLSNDISIPSTIYLSIDKEFSNFFKETIIGEQFNQYTLTESKFNVIDVNPEFLHSLIQFKTDNLRDPGLMVDGVYINNFFMK